jgi:hypothetical protein
LTWKGKFIRTRNPFMKGIRFDGEKDDGGKAERKRPM